MYNEISTTNGNTINLSVFLEALKTINKISIKHTSRSLECPTPYFNKFLLTTAKIEKATMPHANWDGVIWIFLRSQYDRILPCIFPYLNFTEP